MMTPSHLLAALLIGLGWSQVRRFKPRDWALAVGFAVVIDLDHTLQLPVYLASHGIDGLTAAAVVHWGGHWQGFMHTPWGLLLVVPACFAFRTLIPAVFWGLHMVQDFVVATRYVVFGSAQEWLIVVALALLVAAGLKLDQLRHGEPGPLWRHAARQAGWTPRASASAKRGDAATDLPDAR